LGSLVFDIDEHEGRDFIAMEFLDGQTLKHRIKEKRLSTDEILDLAIQIADGLDAAHAKGAKVLGEVIRFNMTPWLQAEHPDWQVLNSPGQKPISADELKTNPVLGCWNSPYGDWFIKSHLEAAYLLQSSKTAAFLPNITSQDGATTLEDFLIPRLNEVQQLAALPDKRIEKILDVE
jgi:serine/threonine protein kinase